MKLSKILSQLDSKIREKIVAIVRKCAKEDAKSGRPWCVYKPEESGSSKSKKPQPKGWPKTYKTKEDAEYGVKMMKTFGK